MDARDLGRLRLVLNGQGRRGQDAGSAGVLEGESKMGHRLGQPGRRELGVGHGAAWETARGGSGHWYVADNRVVNGAAGRNESRLKTQLSAAGVCEDTQRTGEAGPG